MAERPAGYGGQGFSLRSDKDRFVLPAKLRSRIVDRNKDRVVCIGMHEKWPCLTAFGADFTDSFETILDREAALQGHAFDRDARSFQLWDFEEVPFDASGRFVLPATYAQIGSIGTALYFQGAGDYITLWSPEVLLAQDAPVFRSAQAKCRAEMALAEGRRK